MGLTMILVTHRPEQVQRADQSLRIDGGKLVCLDAPGGTPISSTPFENLIRG
jgi:ABC-type transport system involved in cytochrome bd biosynthesis fused ATPase/permease subunit